jgi:hypothetical protein
MSIVLLLIILVAGALVFAFWKEVLKFIVGAGIIGVILYFVVKQHG